jgi:hypothetical protein
VSARRNGAPQAAEGLDALERWVQGAIAQEQGPAACAPGEVERRVLPSSELSALERLSIYSDMVRLRLVECLAEDFPALRYALGPERFAGLAERYLARHPSSHYSLNVLGRHMAAFLAAEAGLRNRGFLAELAELERALQEVFDAPAATSITADELMAVPRERWPGMRLVTIPALRLFAFRWPVNAFYQAFREDREPRPPRRAPSWVAVYRKSFTVWRADLDRERHALLFALASGATLGEAVERCAAVEGADRERIGRSIAAWFQEWAAEGLFRRNATSES